MSNKPEMKIVFAPGCFDDFTGTQEELDAIVAEITQMTKDGTLLENSEPIDTFEFDDEDLVDDDLYIQGLFGGGRSIQ